MNSNGIRLAEDFDLCRRLADLGVYVILSLNTFDPETSRRLHGRDLTAVKQQAIENLARAGVRMTLLNVLIRDVNEDAPGRISGPHAAARPHPQPDRADDDLHRPRRRAVSAGAGTFRSTRRHGSSAASRAASCEPTISSAGPSAHPLCYLVCYLLKSGERLLPFARFRPARRDRAAAGRFVSCCGPTWPRISSPRRSTGSMPTADRASGHAAAAGRAALSAGPGDRAISSASGWPRRACGPIYLHAHMDEDTFDCSRAMLCPDLVPAEPGRLIPACTYNLFYRMQDERFFVGLPDKRRTTQPMRTLGMTHSVCETCRRSFRPRSSSEDGDVYLREVLPRARFQPQPACGRDVDDYLRTLRYVKPAWVPRDVRRQRGRRVSRRLRLLFAPRAAPVHADRRDHLALRSGLPGVSGRCRRAVGHDAGGIGRDARPLIAAERQIDVLNFSGGEPLLHPELLGLVDEALRRPEIVRVSISTNGLALLRRPELLGAAAGAERRRLAPIRRLSRRRSTRCCAAGRSWRRNCASWNCCGSRASRPR